MWSFKLDHTVRGVVFLIRPHTCWCGLSHLTTQLLVWSRSPDDPLAECVLQIRQLLQEAGVGPDRTVLSDQLQGLVIEHTDMYNEK